MLKRKTKIFKIQETFYASKTRDCARKHEEVIKKVSDCGGGGEFCMDA